MNELRGILSSLVRTKACLWTAIDREMSERGVLALAPTNLLGAVDEKGRCRVQDLAVDALITTGGASQAVDRLTAMGLCQRVSNPDDRRSSFVELTPQGQRALTEANAVLDEILEERFSSLSGPDRRQFAELLARVRGDAPS